MVDYRPLHEMLGQDQLTLEQAQALKKEVRSQQTIESKDLEALMEQHKREAKEAYYKNKHGLDLVIAKLRELVGRGAEHEYKRHLRELGVISAQLNTMADNTEKLTSEYREKMQHTKESLYEQRQLFELNAIIYTEKNKVSNQYKEQLSALEKQSVLGTSCTTEAIRLQKQLLELESDLIGLNHENDELAVKLMVNKSLLDTQQETYGSLQELHGSIERQRSIFNTYYEIAVAQERVTEGVRGANNAKETFMYAAVMVQKLTAMQEQLGKRGVEGLPKAFDLPLPKQNGKRDPNRPYWQTVAEAIRAPRA